MTYDELGDCYYTIIGNFRGECPILETGRQVTVHFAIAIIVSFVKYSPGFTTNISGL